MKVDSELFHSNSEDSFMLAVERLEAGEALEDVLADVSDEEREELRELLTVVAATHHLQEIDIPRPSPERRAATKAAFLQTAMEMTPATVDASVAVDTSAKEIQSTADVDSTHTAHAGSLPLGTTLLDRLHLFWEEIRHSLSPMTLRLAPLVIMLIAVWLGAFSVVTVAQAAIPGDVVYPAKTWMLNQELALSAPADRPEVYDRIVETIKQDTEKAKERAAAQRKIIPTESTLIFRGWGTDYIYVGDLAISYSLSTLTRFTDNSVDGSGRIGGSR